MENINCSSNDRNSSTDGVDYYFEQDYVFSALNLFANFPVPPQKSSAAQEQDDKEALSFDQKTCQIDDMLKKLKDCVIEEKEQEIRDLKNKLENKSDQILQFEDKLTKLVDFITFMHGKFGNLMESMISMLSSGGNESFLYFGPFNKASTKNEFVQILKDLSVQLSRDYEDLSGTRELMEKVNLILKGTKNATLNKKQGNILPVPTRSLRNDPESQCNALVTEDLEGFHSAVFPVSSAKQAAPSIMPVPTPMTPPLNLTMRVPPSQCTAISRPPPSKSRNSMQNNLNRNLGLVKKKHGVDHSKRHWGHFCLCQGTKFSSKASLMVHIRRFTMDKHFECNICQKRYLYQSLLRVHMISSHKIENIVDGIATCSICHGKYGNLDDFFAHLQTCHFIKDQLPSPSFSHKKRNGSHSHRNYRDITPIPTLQRDADATLTIPYASMES